jgi:hypothetical protein
MTYKNNRQSLFMGIFEREITIKFNYNHYCPLNIFLLKKIKTDFQ